MNKYLAYISFSLAFTAMTVYANSVSVTGKKPFCEITIDDSGLYDVDVDFDGVNERICVDENGYVEVFMNNGAGTFSNNVSNDIPFSSFRVHRCCEAHKAYTTLNYQMKTIYIEAHYGCCNAEKRQYQKVVNGWVEIIPVKPLSILQKNLYPSIPVGWVYNYSRPVWKW